MALQYDALWSPGELALGEASHHTMKTLQQAYGEAEKLRPLANSQHQLAGHVRQPLAILSMTATPADI